jgi:hypothetical protein
VPFFEQRRARCTYFICKHIEMSEKKKTHGLDRKYEGSNWTLFNTLGFVDTADDLQVFQEGSGDKPTLEHALDIVSVY